MTNALMQRARAATGMAFEPQEDVLRKRVEQLEAALARIDAVLAEMPTEAPDNYHGYGHDAGYASAEYDIAERLRKARKGE